MSALPRTTACRIELPDGHKLVVDLLRFEKAGDELPLHNHPYWHNCVVFSGRVEVSEGAGKRILTRGQATEFPVGQDHAIKALDDQTLTLHMANVSDL